MIIQIELNYDIVIECLIWISYIGNSPFHISLWNLKNKKDILTRSRNQIFRISVWSLYQFGINLREVLKLDIFSDINISRVCVRFALTSRRINPLISALKARYKVYVTGWRSCQSNWEILSECISNDLLRNSLNESIGKGQREKEKVNEGERRKREREKENREIEDSIFAGSMLISGVVRWPCSRLVYTSGGSFCSLSAREPADICGASWRRSWYVRRHPRSCDLRLAVPLLVPLPFPALTRLVLSSRRSKPHLLIILQRLAPRAKSQFSPLQRNYFFSDNAKREFFFYRRGLIL